MKHLVVDISAHGFGHLAQTVAVLNALDTRQISLTIRSMASEEILKERLKHSFNLIPYQQDHGMVMLDALNVDEEATLQHYEDFHKNYNERTQQAIEDLKTLKADLVLADVPYLSLSAAKALNIPCIALCSLNWADVFNTYCGHYPSAKKIHAEITQAYAGANLFLQATPSMPMESLANRRPISPIVLVGNKQLLADKLQTTQPQSKMRFVLVALGGIGMDYPLETWPQIDNVYWIFNDADLSLQRDDFIPTSRFDLPYIDLLSSCDVVLTKTGYGTQTEAVVNQVPTLCVTRGDWPEEPYLFDWHQQYGEIEFINWQDVLNGNFGAQLSALLSRTWQKEPVLPTGNHEAATILMDYLFGDALENT